MRRRLLQLWHDDGGALIATEWVFVATILVIGSITALVAVRQSVLTELEEVGLALLGLSQSYSLNGQAGVCAAPVDANLQPTLSPSTTTFTAGSAFRDASDGVSITGIRPEQPSLVDATPCD